MFVAVTDNEWFRFLRNRPDLDEVNFWQPGGGRHFRALEPGGLFLFKLHAPEDFIVGGGFFAHFSLVGHRQAWEWFGERNGVRTLEQMRQRLEKYRRKDLSPFEDATIGCIMLSRPFFWQQEEWIPMPADFARNIVVGKGYDTASERGRQLWEGVQLRLRGSEIAEPAAVAPMWGEPRPVRPRLGQGTFRSLVTDVYSRRCAVSGEKALPALDAAHIRPVAAGGIHEVANGLLLRSDIHRLYDSGYVTITPDHRFEVSRRLKTDFDNGEPYYPLAGRLLSLPDCAEHHPYREHLEWHADTVFRR